MRNNWLFIFLLLAAYAQAQSDTATYRVIMNDGSQFSCKIIELKRGEYIKVKKEDNSVSQIGWDAFKDYRNPADDAKAKAANREQRIKSRWDEAFIVRVIGDTVFGKIERRDDYSIYSFASDKKELHFLKRGTTDILDIYGTVELHVFTDNPEFQKYIFLYANELKRPIFSDSTRKTWNIYRVVVDGPCKLLYDEGPSLFGMPEFRHQFFYKGVLKPANSSLLFNEADFKRYCREALSDCPEVVAKTDKGVYKAKDLSKIVKEFNECISGK